ncbi:MAG: hypothetical protein JWL63_3446 [Rhodocyclales bacterium]|nr:hypothetical protein [Rhodocyclales bacterium]
MNPTKPEQSASPELAAMSEARRKLIRAGLATGPVIATLASPSVFAIDCVAPSQTLSAAKSHATTQLGSCSAPDSCDTWKSRLGNSGCTAQEATWRDTKFHTVFTQQSGSTGCHMFKTGSNGVATPMSFYEVLALTDSSSGVQIARQFVAAYLNICANKVLFPVGGSSTQAKSAQAVVDMWNEWAIKGSYTPYAGATAWDGTKVGHYLTYFVP